MTARDQLSSELKGRGDAVEKLQTELAGAKSQLECLNLIKSELELKNAEKVELSETVAKLKVYRHSSHRLNNFLLFLPLVLCLKTLVACVNGFSLVSG